MANDNNIKNFTASDIEKYHKGQLSAKEMHNLEKAALDDPFLADALEGYAVTNTNVNADIAELKKRLAEKTEQAKVIPLHTAERSSFPWMRAAILIVLIAGAGLVAYQFLFTSGNKEEQIAQAPNKNEKAKSQDTGNLTPQIINTDSSSEYKTGVPEKTIVDSKINAQKNLAADINKSDKAVKDSIVTSFGYSSTEPPTTSAPVKTAEDDKAIKNLRNDNALERSAIEKNKELALKKPGDPVKQRNEVTYIKTDSALKDKNKNVTLNKPAFKDADGVADMYYKAKEEVVVNGYATSKRAENLYRNTNVFHGRVTDATNNALPFANITNRQDNVGTYSDAQGNFTLVSPDTVLNVQVRSLGFESNNVQLRGFVANNQIIMQEDKSLNARVLDTVKRNISRARSSTMTFEEPEPEDGWPAYQSYVLNNLNMPEKIDIKKSGETADNIVEVSFEVGKNGEPVNIKVEKSLCDKCDQEAIRLIKDGPKWKRKGKKGKRTTVSVPFIKP